MRGPSYTGRTLGGRYAVGELLGEGGWGAVYAAVQTDLGRKVALKILHVDVALARDAVSRFEREARAAAAFGHPNIVQVTDFQANPGEPPFLVMELLTGATLGSVLARQVVLPPPRVVTIAFQMLSALDVAHHAGIVHRDVKPDNVFLVSMPGIEDFVKLLDFGIAKLSAENVAQLTGDGQMLGSPAFMSPEQVRSQAIDHRADLYAVGATMYFALAGRLPFDTTNIASLLAAIMEQPPIPLSVVAPGVDPRLAALVERALQKDPGLRFASAGDMRGALEPWVSSRGVTPSTMRDSSPMGAHAPSVSHPHVNPMGATFSPESRQPSWPSYAQRGAASGPSVANGASGPSGASRPSGASGASVASGPLAGSVSAAAPPFSSVPSHGHGSMGGHAPVPAASPPRSASPVLLALVLVLGALVVVCLFGVGVALFLARQAQDTGREVGDPSVSPSATTLASSAPKAVSSAAPVASTSSAAMTSSTTQPRVTPTGPTPSPTPSPAVVDAGGAKVVVVDAGARTQFAGATPKYSGGSFEAYDMARSKAEIARVTPMLGPCFAATEFVPPDHQFTDWTLTIDPLGNVTDARRTTAYSPHAKLDPCVVAVLRTMKWDARPPGPSPRISLTARTRDNL